MLKLLFNILKVSVAFTFLFVSVCIAQEKTTDSLLTNARKAAYSDKDYAKAKRLCLEALNLNPEEHTIRAFLGRIYSWTEQADSSRIQFEYVLQKQPDQLDASLGYASLEYWNQNSSKAILITSKALKAHPESEDLLILHAKIATSLKNYDEADAAIRKTLKINSRNTEARSISSKMNQNSANNSVAVNYSFAKFAQQSNAPWHISGLEYSKNTSLGAVTGRLSYANRFNRNGLQLEAEAYPKLSKTVYAFINGGFSSQDGIFPHYKGALSVFSSLPAHFEAELGMRFLKFNSTNEIYTAAISKYYRNYWFNLRTYLSPDSGSLSQSYFLASRYYFGGSDDYFTFGLGTGISPDDIDRNILLNPAGTTSSYYNINAGFKKAFKVQNILSVNAGWNNQQLQTGGYSNQYEIGFGFQRRF